MWCPSCRQDVPAIAAAFEQSLCCVRCRQPLTRLNEDASAAKTVSASAPTGADDLELLTDQQQVEIDEILSRAEWLLGLDASEEPRSQPRRRIASIHRGQVRVPGHHLSMPPAKSRPRRQSRVMITSWCALAVALTGFVCGGVLLTWSLLANRPELWNVGETVTLASQVGLLVGLILQLDRIGHDRHQTVNRLTLLDERVESLRTGSRRWDSNDALAPNAASESMLADLKHQLDRLASKLTDKRSA